MWVGESICSSVLVWLWVYMLPCQYMSVCECEGVSVRMFECVSKRQTNVSMSMVSMRLCEHVCEHCECVSIWVCDCVGVLWKSVSVSVNVWVCLSMLV